MDQHTPDALAPMRAALAATDAAARAVVMELDYWTGMTPSFVMPTSLLMKLDHWRECEAMMFQFLPDHGITSAQVHAAFEHAVAVTEQLVPTVDSIAGPMEDQEDPYTQYMAGLLSAEEFIQVAKDSHLRTWIVEKLS